MFIGHYKAVNNSGEFYARPRDDLQFPTQVVYDGVRYLLTRTVQFTSKSTETRFYKSAKESGIPVDVEID